MLDDRTTHLIIHNLYITLPLGHLGTVRVEQKWQMSVLRWFEPKCGIEVEVEGK